MLFKQDRPHLANSPLFCKALPFSKGLQLFGQRAYRHADAAISGQKRAVLCSFRSLVMRRLPFFSVLLLVIAVFLGSYFYFSHRSDARNVPALLPSGQLADQVIIEKGARRLTLMRRGEAIATYSVRLGFAPIGQKMREGDGKTPEGHYRIDRRNDRSAFHLSLGLNYPTAAQRVVAKEKNIDPGGDIFIHGQPNHLGDSADLVGGLPYDWTEGCVALSNNDMRTIWQHVALGTPVIVKP